ncbi:MAG: thiamine-phosphate kinase [Dehalococcoidia bacterium]|nr:thiamine-phosphate kinase [Dehalococcoidia bacterium]
MKVSELGEFGLIDLLAQTIGRKKEDIPPQVILGIGDDTAAWREDSPIHLATTDTMVEGIHFDISKITWEELGWKSLAVNISDIAAMGGTSRYALVTLAIPGDTLVDNVLALYRGIKEIAGQFNVSIIGGDTVKSHLTIITVALYGTMENEAGELMTRSAALPGEIIGVTGYLGSSAAGLKMVSNDMPVKEEQASYLRKAHYRPQPRAMEGRQLFAAGVRCAIDISDGLIGDLTHVCKTSSVGAILKTDSLPVHPFVEANFPGEGTDFALSGGEDYELLFTAEENLFKRLRQQMSTPITAIGSITGNNPGKVTLVDKKGNSISRQKKGWDHFRPDNSSPSDPLP